MELHCMGPRVMSFPFWLHLHFSVFHQVGEYQGIWKHFFCLVLRRKLWGDAFTAELDFATNVVLTGLVSSSA